jgi:hypothetical protein
MYSLQYYEQEISFRFLSVKGVYNLGHVKLGRVFNFCIYMHIGPIFRFHILSIVTIRNYRK